MVNKSCTSRNSDSTTLMHTINMPQYVSELLYIEKLQVETRIWSQHSACWGLPSYLWLYIIWGRVHNDYQRDGGDVADVIVDDELDIGNIYISKISGEQI